VDEAEKLEALEQLGSRDPHTAQAHLATAARMPRSPFHPAADDRGVGLARALLGECLESPDLDRALRHLPELLRALLAHGAYLEQLERPALRRGVVRVLGSSDLLARLLAANPGLVPGVLFAGELPPVEAVSAAVQDRVDPEDTEGTLAALRLEKQTELLRIAMADLAAALPPAEVQDRLTRLAEDVVEATCRLALAEAEARFGPPEDPEAALVILAGGTLGAKELGYRSDVDLSALYAGRGHTTGGRREKIALSELYTRVMQRMLSFLTLRMPQGDLYPVDMRLRPSGSQGVLVASLESFESYHREGRARLWERQALVRTRVIVGPPALRGRVERALFESTYGPPHTPEGAREIDAMRRRMERERSRGRMREGRLDLKLGPGGLVEAEFLVQHLLLLHARDRPDLATPRTRDALAQLAAAGLLPEATGTRLAGAHLRLRRVVDWLRVIHDEMLDVVDLRPETLRPVALALRYQGRDAQDRLRADLEADRAAVRGAYSEILETRP
jgi:glutamate-ammonia-ligase adenylyltransferase